MHIQVLYGCKKIDALLPYSREPTPVLSRSDIVSGSGDPNTSTRGSIIVINLHINMVASSLSKHCTVREDALLTLVVYQIPQALLLSALHASVII